MQKMRGATKYILWLLILSFGVLWMVADTQVFDSLMRGPRSAGEVNGEEIGIDEYQQRIQYYVQQYNRQNDGQVTAERRAYFEEQAWNELVATKILQQKMKEMGIQVTDAELVQMITGENPDPLIKRQFQREDGTINRAALRNAIESERNTRMWIMIEERLRQKRRQQKISTYIQSALDISEYEIRESYVRNNSYVDISFVRFPYADIPQEEISISEEDMREYYNNNQQQFERKKTYSFEYVGFDKTPTDEDTMRTIKELRGLRSEFAKTQEDSAFLARYQTDAGYEPTQIKKTEIKEAFKPVLELENGEVTGVIKADDKYHILKKLNETEDQIKFIRLTYNVEADPIATIEEAHETADDFSYFAEQNSFAKEAKRRDLQLKSGTATKENNFIPGIGQSRQIMQFLESAGEGELSRPIELDNQFVVIMVNDVKPAGVQPFEEVKSQIRTQVMNQKRKQKMMEKASSLVSNNNALEAVAKAADKQVQQAEQISLGSTVIPDAGREPKVIGAMFGLEEGAISSPIEGNSAVFVVKVLSKDMADPQNLDSNSRQKIAQTLRREKQSTYMQVWMEELKESAEIVDYRDQVFR